MEATYTGSSWVGVKIWRRHRWTIPLFGILYFGQIKEHVG